MKKPRKKYRPIPVNPRAYLVAMMGACSLSRDDVLIRAESLHSKVELIAQGKATQDDWRWVFDCINAVEELCRMKIAQGLDVVESLQEVMAEVLDRQKATGTKALRASELAALRDFAADYTEILSGVTQQQYMTAQRRVEDRIRRVLSGERIPASWKVVEA
jgi:hypothetical protein